MRRSGRAFTLLEALITLLLVSLLLGLVAGLVQEYGRAMRFSLGKERSLAAAQVGLERVQTELREACALLTPATVGVPSSVLALRKVDPSAARLPWPLTPAPGWEPHMASWVLEIHYFCAGDELIREVETSPPVRLSLAEGITGFSVERLGDGNVKLSLSVQEANRVRSMQAEVYSRSLRP